MDLLHAIDELVRLVAERPDAEDDDLAAALVGHGLSREDAERVVAFAPLAFGRQLLSHLRPRVPVGYEIRDPDSGRSIRGVTKTEPAYVAALEYAHLHPDNAGWVRVGARSCEVQAASTLVHQGGPLVRFACRVGLGFLIGIAFTEPLLLRIPLPPTKP
jgi:hypothetical protein